MAENNNNNNKKDKVACQYCGKEYSRRGIKNHEIACKENPDNKPPVDPKPKNVNTTGKGKVVNKGSMKIKYN